MPLPALLRYGKGMVTLNSTSGLSALIHHMPVKVLGRVHYDIPGMTFQGSLADFGIILVRQMQSYFMLIACTTSTIPKSTVVFIVASTFQSGDKELLNTSMAKDLKYGLNAFS